MNVRHRRSQPGSPGGQDPPTGSTGARDGTAGAHGDTPHGAHDLGPPSPDALLATLDERQLAVLRRVGREWDTVCGNPEVWRRALPVDLKLDSYPDPTDVQPTRFGRFVPV